MQQPTQSGTNVTDGPDSDPVSLGFSSLDSSDSSDDNYSKQRRHTKKNKNKLRSKM